MSGTSSKLAKSSTYHHFTLLLHADTRNLHHYLSPHPNVHIVYSCLCLCVVSRFSSVFTFLLHVLVSLLMFSILYIHCHLLKILSYPTCTQLKITKSTATQSRRSEVINLSSVIPSLSYESVCSAISSKFYDVHGVTQNRKVQCTYICVFVTILLKLCSRDHYYAKKTCMYMYV